MKDINSTSRSAGIMESVSFQMGLEGRAKVAITWAG